MLAVLLVGILLSAWGLSCGFFSKSPFRSGVVSLFPFVFCYPININRQFPCLVLFCPKTSYFKRYFQLEGGSLHLPLLDPSMRATPLTPSKWKERLKAKACLDVPSSETPGDTSGRRLLLLDVRNGEVLLHCTWIQALGFGINTRTLFLL